MSKLTLNDEFPCVDFTPNEHKHVMELITNHLETQTLLHPIYHNEIPIGKTLLNKLKIDEKNLPSKLYSIINLKGQPLLIKSFIIKYIMLTNYIIPEGNVRYCMSEHLDDKFKIIGDDFILFTIEESLEWKDGNFTGNSKGGKVNDSGDWYHVPFYKIARLYVETTKKLPISPLVTNVNYNYTSSNKIKLDVDIVNNIVNPEPVSIRLPSQSQYVDPTLHSTDVSNNNKIAVVGNQNSVSVTVPLPNNSGKPFNIGASIAHTKNGGTSFSVGARFNF